MIKDKFHVSEVDFPEGEIKVSSKAKKDGSPPDSEAQRKIRYLNLKIYNYYAKLVNVIVFATVGNRPDQQKMSGGDLDGDVYHCCWEEKIVSEITPTDP